MRVIPIFFLFSIVLLISGCSCPEKKGSPLSRWMEDSGKIKVLSTTALIDDLVEEIGGEQVDHLALVTGELDPHSYELVKGDLEKLDRAQLIICNGLGLEHGASLHHKLQMHSRLLSIGEEIKKRSPDSILTVEGQADPHIWMDISLWMQAVNPIVEALSSLDSKNAVYYQARGELLYQKMQKIDAEIFDRLQEIPENKRFLVTSHDAFKYFARRYLAERDESSWRVRFAAPEGLAPEGQLSSLHIQEIIDHLSLHRITIVFPESNVSKDSLKKIVSACREKDFNVVISRDVLYGDALGPPSSEAHSYLKMMQYNAEVLRKAWQ